MGGRWVGIASEIAAQLSAEWNNVTIHVRYTILTNVSYRFWGCCDDSLSPINPHRQLFDNPKTTSWMKLIYMELPLHPRCSFGEKIEHNISILAKIQASDYNFHKSINDTLIYVVEIQSMDLKANYYPSLQLITVLQPDPFYALSSLTLPTT